MGVRTLEGTYDGTEQAAVMVDSTSGWAVGPIWTGPDAVEQIEAFTAWMRREPWLNQETLRELGLTGVQMPTPRPATDPRSWPEAGLAILVRYWRERNLDEHGQMAGAPA